MSEGLVTCAQCEELQSSDFLRCARCGASLETTQQRRDRLAKLERSRRDAERDDVSIQRIPGFGSNATRGPKFGARGFFDEMSNQRRRRFLITLGVIVVCFVVVLTR